MWRYLAGAVSALMLVAAGLMLGKGLAGGDPRIPAMPAEAPAGIALADSMAFGAKAPVPTASERSREEKRFDRYDRDKNGAVSQAEYLVSRRKAYDRLDANGDGIVSFDEYAAKANAKFAKADADKSAALNRSEFSTTRVVRKSKPKPACPPVRQGPVPSADQEEAGDDA